MRRVGSMPSVSGIHRNFPRRSTAPIRCPKRLCANSAPEGCGAAGAPCRRSKRSSITSTPVQTAPVIWDANPRRTVSTSGSSGMSLPYRPSDPASPEQHRSVNTGLSSNRRRVLIKTTSAAPTRLFQRDWLIFLIRYENYRGDEHRFKFVHLLLHGVLHAVIWPATGVSNKYQLAADPVVASVSDLTCRISMSLSFIRRRRSSKNCSKCISQYVSSGGTPGSEFGRHSTHCLSIGSNTHDANGRSFLLSFECPSNKCRFTMVSRCCSHFILMSSPVSGSFCPHCIKLLS